MGKTAHGGWRKCAGWSLFLPLLVLASAGLLLMSPHCALAGESKLLWQSRDQFVAIEKQDGKEAETPANDHPAALSVDQLNSMLESLEITATGNNKPLPVFDAPGREVLVKLLLEGLSLAGPREDVTFAVIGQFPALLGLFMERRVTTGRVFFQGGELNIIFGMVHRDIKDNEDRRLAPLVPGSRTRTAKLTGKISAKPGKHAITMKRSDWLAFNPASIGSSPDMPEKSGAQTLKREQADGKPLAGDGTPTTEKKDGRSDSRGRTVEERLLLLNELRNKELITDEEYRAKRREILDEL